MKRPVIYVRQVTNLSDARYCAGMGVDLLGFAVNPGHENYVSPRQYQEMSGWFAGPQRVVEITSLGGLDLSTVTREYAPDFLHLSYELAVEAALQTVPLIIEAPYGSMASAGSSFAPRGLNVRFLLLTDVPPDPSRLAPGEGDMKVLLSSDPQSDPDMGILERTGANGFAMKGTREQSPGLKDYDHLSRLLEKLDE